MVAGGAPRISQFAKYLPESGWAPTVLTASFTAGRALDEHTLAELAERPEIEIVRAWSPWEKAAPRGLPQPRGGWRKLARGVVRSAVDWVCLPDRQRLWARGALRAGRAALLRRKHDVVFATYGPATNLLVGAQLARQAGLPLVVDFRDLWTDYPGARWPTAWHRRRAEALERRAISQASAVVAVSPAMAEHFARKYERRSEDVVSITNGFDPADLERAVDLRESAPQRPFRLCYTGSVYGAHHLEALAGAVYDLACAGSVMPETFRLQFVGSLAASEPARWKIEEFVDVLPPVPHHEVFARLGEADALVMVEGEGYWAHYSYAVKVFDYALTGKPILGLVEPGGNSARLLANLGNCEIALPSARAEIAAALGRLLRTKGLPPRRVEIDQPPLAAFDRRTLTRQLAAVLLQAAEPNRRPVQTSDAPSPEGASACR